MKVLISLKTGIYYYYKGSGDYHCKEGMIEESILKDTKSGVVEANTKRKFLIFNGTGHDYYSKLKRGPQLITEKDMGYIIARCGLNKGSRVVEGGSGSGAAAIMFGRFVFRVRSYEVVEDHLNISRKNAEFSSIDNIEFILGDLADNVESEEEFDLLFLDMPEPSLVLSKDLSGLKSGGYAVCYLPSINQIGEVVSNISDKDDLYFEEVSEVNLRYWKVNERVMRPEGRKEIDHTAFLLFIRKI